MVFSEYMKSLSKKPGPSEKQSAIKKLSEATCKSVLTVYAWIRGDQVPDALTQKVISGVLNIPVDELFPKER